MNIVNLLKGIDFVYEEKSIDNFKIKYFISEYWTSKQRQANNIHEISYRACFKPQLPNFFITRLTNKWDWIYDPFMWRWTTLIEWALLGRNVIWNDVNPLSIILTEPRLVIPKYDEIEKRLDQIDLTKEINVDKVNLYMFFSKKTLIQLVNLKNYFIEKEKKGELDIIDKWIRMVATNRLTGHSSVFFSVYTLPPNQAVSRERQVIINKKRNQQPEDKDIKKLILRKTRQLLKDCDAIAYPKINYLLLNKVAKYTSEIPNNFIKLIVTSPPFLDVVNYSQDNWLRCWFNNINIEEVEKKLTLCRTIECWANEMKETFKEFYRILKQDWFIAFEVGEVKNWKIKLDEVIAQIWNETWFTYLWTLINLQKFTKTSNIWGISNNSKGTNTNRIVLFTKN